MNNIWKYLIMPMLDPLDFFSMRLVCKNFKKLITTTMLADAIIAKTDRDLYNLLGPHLYDAFVSQMIAKRGHLTGSFILQAATNEHHAESDIDIHAKILFSVPEFGLATKTKLYEYECKPFVRNIQTQTVNGKIFQFVEVDRNISKNIMDTDFDICKNFIRYGADGKIKGKILDPVGIVKKSTKFSIIDKKDFVFRYGKYSKRGYTFRPKYPAAVYIEYCLITQFLAHKVSYYPTNEKSIRDELLDILMPPGTYCLTNEYILHINPHFAPGIKSIFFKEDHSCVYDNDFESTDDWAIIRKKYN